MSYQSQPQRYQTRSPAPQLRHSCDGCNAAKVKCSKTRPRCARCETRKVDCVYSVSLRSAKGRAESQRDADSNGVNRDSNNTHQGTLTPAPVTFSTSTGTTPTAASLLEAGFDASILDGWATSFSDIGDHNSFAASGEVDDPMMSLSPIYAENDIGLDHRGQPFSDQHVRHYPTALASIDAHQFNSEPSQCAQTCSCRQKMLVKLSDCWLSSRGSHSPFDKSLSENKAIISLCTSALNCPNRSHTDDNILVLIIIALIDQMIAIYDNPVSEKHSNSTTNSAETLTDTLSVGSSLAPSVASSSPLMSSSATRALQPPLAPPPQRVRLSLGSYQPDQSDEQVLKDNLLRIELNKIGSLIELFERRSCAPEEWRSHNGQGGRVEPKPFGELVTYLRRRLRIAHEALR